jgi:hypothetical protein
MSDPPTEPHVAPETVDTKIGGNDHRVAMVKAAGASLIAVISLISLSQAGSATKFGTGGPKVLTPIAVTAVIGAAWLFGFAYQDLMFASAQMRARIAADIVKRTDSVPADIISRSKRGWNEALGGFFLTMLAVSFYLASVWWPGSRHPVAPTSSTTTTTTAWHHSGPRGRSTGRR